MQELSNRIKEFVSYTKMSVRKFAAECGLKQPTLDKHIRGTADPNATTLIGIANRFPELSLEWLLLGQGDMIKSNKELEDVANANADRLLKLLDTITTLQDCLNEKTKTISDLNERIKQLEYQLNSK